MDFLWIEHSIVLFHFSMNDCLLFYFYLLGSILILPPHFRIVLLDIESWLTVFPFNTFIMSFLCFLASMVFNEETRY